MKNVFAPALLCAFLFPFFVSAQSARFSVYAGTQYDFFTATERTGVREVGVVRQLFPDTLYVREQRRQTETWRTVAEARPGLQAGLQVAFPLSGRLQLHAGLGVENRRFKSRTELLESQSEILSSDTVTDNPFTIIPGGGSSGNVYIQLEAEPDPYHHYSIWNLRVPLGLTYELLPRALSVSAQLGFSIPFASTRSYEYIYLDRGELNGITTFEEKLGRLDDKTADGLNNLLLDGALSLTWHTRYGLAVEAGARAGFSNVFDDPVETSQGFSSGRLSSANAKPNTVFLRVLYSL